MLKNSSQKQQFSQKKLVKMWSLGKWVLQFQTLIGALSRFLSSRSLNDVDFINVVLNFTFILSPLETIHLKRRCNHQLQMICFDKL